MSLTGRYQFKRGIMGLIVLHVEEHDASGFHFRRAKKADLVALEPEVADGWRFREERYGTLCYDGKRIRE